MLQNVKLLLQAVGEEVDIFANDDNDKDIDYVPNEGDASDIKLDEVLKPNKIFDNDDDKKEKQLETQQ